MGIEKYNYTPGIRELMRADLRRHEDKNKKVSFLNAYLTNPGYRYIFYMRLSKYFKDNPLSPPSIFFVE